MKTFTEWLSKIKRGAKLTKKDVPHIEDHIKHSYIDKESLAKISFDSESIYHAKTGKTVFSPRDYIGKLDIDGLIKAIEKKVKNLR
jgi:hypothetical protein